MSRPPASARGLPSRAARRAIAGQTSDPRPPGRVPVDEPSEHTSAEAVEARVADAIARAPLFAAERKLQRSPWWREMDTRTKRRFVVHLAKGFGIDAGELTTGGGQ